MKEFKNDTFLARWLNNELTDEELTAFKASEDYAIYQRIIAGVETIEQPSFDESDLLDRIKASRTSPQSRIILISRRTWVYGIAASVLILLSVGILNIVSTPKPTTISSNVSELKTFVLPDGSEVILNANSTATYLSDDWQDNRKIELEGEAYFKVAKGKIFTVTTSAGTIEVLGTEFSVQRMNGYFEVKCFEGSVKVSSLDEVVVLEPKHSYRRIQRQASSRSFFQASLPTWINNITSFKSKQLRYVLMDLANQYGITFEGNATTNQNPISGSFPHDDLEVALKNVLVPLQIEYKFKEETIVILED